MRARVGGLRSQSAFDAVERVFAALARRDREEAGGAPFRVVHFSVQSNHVHLIVEADEQRALTAGMRGLAVSIARRVNPLFARRGTFWADRYHARALTAPRAVRNALVYVLQNARKHGAAADALDECSSAAWFEGWRRDLYWARVVDDRAREGPPAVCTPHTWLAREGWLRAGGPLGLDECPARPS